jgi:transcriptional regulator with PAS, ATPase and Fis domain
MGNKGLAMDGPLELDELLKLAVDALYLSIVVDETGSLRYIARPYADIIGVVSQEVIGKQIETVIPNTRLRKVIESGHEELGQIFIMKNGAPTICNRFPIRDKDGKIRGAISTATFHDIDKVSILKAEVDKLRKENRFYQQQLAVLKQTPFSIDSVIGNSPSMQKIKATIEKVAQSNLSLLITGETGTGKEVFANAIHQLSNRCFGNFIKVNCAAIPKDLLESELFGYNEGAFSGAMKGGKVGKFEQANNGTILLDEIGELPLSLQSKLLRVIQERELERLGGVKTIKLDVRIICCTNQNIEQMVEEGAFRQDLYYRINIVTLDIPPLRDRLTDIPALCNHCIQKINQYHGCSITGISTDVLRHFFNYSWSGNIRELEHVLERACVMSPPGELDVDHFDFFLPTLYRSNTNTTTGRADNPNASGALSDKKNLAEKEAIIHALESTKGNKSKAAILLQITRSQLYEKSKKYGLS